MRTAAAATRVVSLTPAPPLGRLCVRTCARTGRLLVCWNHPYQAVWPHMRAEWRNRLGAGRPGARLAVWCPGRKVWSCAATAEAREQIERFAENWGLQVVEETP